MCPEAGPASRHRTSGVDLTLEARWRGRPGEKKKKKATPDRRHPPLPRLSPGPGRSYPSARRDTYRGTLTQLGRCARPISEALTGLLPAGRRGFGSAHTRGPDVRSAEGGGTWGRWAGQESGPRALVGLGTAGWFLPKSQSLSVLEVRVLA